MRIQLNDLPAMLEMLDQDRKAMGTLNRGLYADGVLALEQIRLITTAYQNGRITYGEMSHYINRYL